MSKKRRVRELSFTAGTAYLLHARRVALVADQRFENRKDVAATLDDAAALLGLTVGEFSWMHYR
jgi:hypothetical protein